jgi:hypothetical protein
VGFSESVQKVDTSNRLKLSRLQKFVLKAALASLWNRETLCDDNSQLVHLFNFEVLILYFDLPSRYIYGRSNDDTRWLRDLGGQRFDPNWCENYSSAYASLPRSLNRLRDRGLITIWRGMAYSSITLTEAGLRLAEQLVRPGVQSEPLSFDVLSYQKGHVKTSEEIAAELRVLMAMIR